MRKYLIVAEVAMLGGCLALVWFGSQGLKVKAAPEAGKILTEAVELTEVVEESIRDADALRAAGDIELVYQPSDRQLNAVHTWDDLRPKLDEWLTDAQLASIDAIDFTDDPVGARAVLTRIDRQMNSRLLPIVALVVAGVLIVGVMGLEKRRKQDEGPTDTPAAATAS